MAAKRLFHRKCCRRCDDGSGNLRPLGVGRCATVLGGAFRETFFKPASQDATGVASFFLKGTKSGVQAAHAARLARQLQRLDVAQRPQDMNVPGWRLHPLKGDQKGHWSVWVSGNWRLTFMFEGEDAVFVDYQDYH